MINDEALISAISKWIDGSESYRGLDPEAHLWRRTMKISGEAGEVQDAICGMLGENPRKGVTHTVDDVLDELLDVAVSSLGAVEYITGNQGVSLRMLSKRIQFVAERAGLIDAG